MKTGMDLLKERLIELGATKAQAEAGVVPYVVAALAADTEGKFEELKKTVCSIKQAEEIFKRAEIEHYNAQSKKADAVYEREKAEEAIRKNEALLCELRAEKQKFDDEIQRMETPEMRDRMKAARFYRDNTEVTNGYERCAFIKGLGAILTCVKLDDVFEED